MLCSLRQHIYLLDAYAPHSYFNRLVMTFTMDWWSKWHTERLQNDTPRPKSQSLWMTESQFNLQKPGSKWSLDQVQDLSHIKPGPQILMPTGTKSGTGHMGTMVNRKGNTTTQLLPNINLLKKKQTSGFYVPSPDFLILATNSLCLKRKKKNWRGHHNKG